MVVSRVLYRSIVVGALSVVAPGSQARAQSAVELWVEAARAVKVSEAAQLWNVAFRNAAAIDVIATFPSVSDSTSGHSEQARIRAQTGSEVFVLASPSWRCGGMSDEFVRARCALQDSPHYIAVAGGATRGDTALVGVRVFSRTVDEGPQWLRMVVYAVRDGSRWRVVRTQRLMIDRPEDIPPSERE